MTRPRQRRYAPRPEMVKMDWPSAFKVALIVTVLTMLLQFVFTCTGLTAIALLSSA